jgi:hypothetical protein
MPVGDEGSRKEALHDTIPAVCLTWDGEHLQSFQELVQQGLGIRIEVGATVREVLCNQIGIDPEYVDQRIQTIFMDGKAVDDFDTAIVRDGATLALSAAMPGLVGAVMRKGGYYASLRHAITYEEGGEETRLQDGLITLKLYNMIARELGPHLLESGALVGGPILCSFLEGRNEDFWKHCRAARIDDREIEPETLGKNDWLGKQPLVRLMSKAAT